MKVIYTILISALFLTATSCKKKEPKPEGWELSNTGIPATHNGASLAPMRISALSETIIYCSFATGELAVSENGGGNWKFVGEGLPQGAVILSFARSVDGKHYLSVSSNAQTTDADGVYYRNQDSGSWIRIGPGYFAPVFGNQTEFNAGADQIVVIDDYIFTDSGFKYKIGSPAGSRSWEVINTNVSSGFESMAVNQGVMYACSPSLFFISTDKGITWVQKMSGLPSDIQMFAITITGGNVYIGTDDGIYKANIANMVWSKLAVPITNGIQVVTLASTQDGKIFAGTTLEGVYMSLDNGVSWTRWSDGLTMQAGALSLTIAGNRIFLTTGAGIFVRSIS